MSNSLKLACCIPLWAVAAGCQGNVPSQTAKESIPQQSEAEVKVAFWTPQGPAMLARRADRLDIRAGCAVLVGDSGQVTLPIFPKGKASWDSKNGKLVLGGQSYKPGDIVELSGGAIGLESLELTSAPSQLFDCPTENLFLVWLP